MTVLFEPILALHIINFSSWRNYWGKYFHGGGGGDCSPAPPGSTPMGASDLDEQGGGGMCTVADPGFAKKGVGGKIRARSAPCVREARASYGWGPGPRRRAPGGVQGQSPRKLSSFQQIRAFKMVVRSDRKCNFSRCNFAYRALVGGRGCGSHQIFRSSW